MTLTVTLELSDEDLAHFRSVMRRARARNGERPAAETAAAATRAVQQLSMRARSPFISRRLARVERLIAMLSDPQWSLPDADRRRVIDALAYVAELHDLVPDDVPVLVLLDDAIMLELVLRDVEPELEAFDEFDAYRNGALARAGHPGGVAAVSPQDWLDARREALLARMRARREVETAQRGEGFSLVTRF